MGTWPRASEQGVRSEIIIFLRSFVCVLFVLL